MTCGLESTRQRADEGMVVLQAALGQWGGRRPWTWTPWGVHRQHHAAGLGWPGAAPHPPQQPPGLTRGAGGGLTRRNNNQGVGQWLRWQSPPVRWHPC